MVKPGFKQTEVGEIPEDWEALTIGEITEWKSGGTPSRDNESFWGSSRFPLGGTPSRDNESFWKGTIPWISGSTLKSSEIYTSDQFLTQEAVLVGSKMAPLNSTLLLVRGSALHNEIRAGLVVAPVSFNQDVKALVPDKSVSPKYLTFYILGMKDALLKLVSSAGNSAGVLDTELVKNFKFLRPELEEQKAIAKALSDVDELIASLEKLIAKKRDIKTATMQQLLTGKKRLPGFGEGKGYQQTELGEIPEDWIITKLGDLFEITSSKRVFQSEWKNRGIPFYRARELAVLGENGKVENDLFITQGMYDSFKKQYGVPEVGDMLVTGVGTLGKTYVVRDEREFYFKDGNIIWFKMSGKVAAEYIDQLFKTPTVIKQISDSSAGTTVGTYTITDANNTLIPLPSSDEEQMGIGRVLADMDADIFCLRERLEKTKDIKQGMMQELLTGRTRLVDVTEQAKAA